jgi:hypothetical protein
MARQWLTLQRDLKIRQLLKLATIRLSIESGRGILWLIRATVQGAPELFKEAVSLVELGSLLMVKAAPKIKANIEKVQDRIDLSFTKLDSILKDLSKTIGAMPIGGYFFDWSEETEELPLPSASVDEPVTNIREATKGRHLIILGDTGTGKTTTAQYVAVENAILGGVKVKVYDCEGMFKLLPGWQLIGAGEDFDAINVSMEEDLQALSTFFQSSQPEAKEPTDIYIGEEFPDIADQCKAATQWVDRHSRRGRKAGKFLILLSQYDQIAAFGLEGKSSLLKNFCIVRLGQFALEHAKRLKNPALTRWLGENRSHCLINDAPLKLPSYEDMVRFIHQSQSVIQPVVYNPASLTGTYQPNHNGLPKISPEATENQGFQPLEGLQTQILEPLKSSWESQWEAKFWEVWQALQDGKSNYWIGGNIFDVNGGTSYQRLCERLDDVRGRIGS